MLAGVGPGVTVVDVEQEVEARGLDALAQCHDVGQVLAHPLALVLGTSQRGVDEKANAHGVQPLVFEIGQHIRDATAILIIVNGAMLLIFCQQGYITADILGGGGGCNGDGEHASKE